MEVVVEVEMVEEDGGFLERRLRNLDRKLETLVVGGLVVVAFVESLLEENLNLLRNRELFLLSEEVEDGVEETSSLAFFSKLLLILFRSGKGADVVFLLLASLERNEDLVLGGARLVTLCLRGSVGTTLCLLLSEFSLSFLSALSAPPFKS